jgi:hypothetical protein
MTCKNSLLLLALVAAMPAFSASALAAVNAGHDPSRERSAPSASVPLEKILEFTHNQERSLPLECRGYNVSEKSRREAVTRQLNRCE